MPLELLAARPLAGTLRERHYDLSPRDNTWVRFDDGRGGEWAGVFGNHGGSYFCAAVPFPDDDGRTVLVVARGEGYIVDSRSGILLRRPRWGDACGALAAPGRDGILVASSTMIWAAGRTRDDYAQPVERLPWAATDNPYDRHRVAVEGIIFHGVTHSALSGVAREPEEWRRFHLRLDDLRFERREPVGAGIQCLATESYGGCPPSPDLSELMRRYQI
jgi:hypothetical protein